MLPRGKQKIMTKESLSKDGDVSGEPKRHSDDAPKLALSLSCCKSGVMMQRKSPRHKHDDDVSKIRQASDTKPRMRSQKAHAKIQLGTKGP
jgi:hypothetical protein